jgi:branched-subunit amino acid transport protein
MVTTVVAIKTKHALGAVAVGMVCFYGLRWVI